MNRRINLTGKNSNDIYSISYPKNLLYFMKYDFNLFMERCVDLCKLYMKTGEYRPEEAAEIRNSISGCHKYFEQNLRGAFEKIVIDCWVEYICRQNEIGVITLWNNYIPCRNDFEKAVFMRLSEYRHGHAINQWVNILKVQEYANIKVDFIFGGKLKSSAEATARANYFDLMFNVVANELGYDLNAVSDNRVFTMGRTPNSPFIMSSVSREIVRNLLTDLRYGDDAKARQKKNEAVSDQTAMDAFASMKGFLPARNDNIVETMIKSLAETPAKVYMPTSLKAAVDLEMDVVIENGAYLQKCELCKDYFMRSEDYDYEYCDKLSKSGRSCLDIMSKKGAVKEKKKIESIDAALLNERCDRLYKEMSARINVEFTQRDFSDWCRYMNTMRDNILSGDASLRDFENFAEYSRSMSFLPGSKKITSGNTALANNRPEKPAESKDSRGRTVKPFVFERVDRREVERAENMLEHYAPDDEEELPVTPTVTHKTPTPAPAPARARTRIIRGRGPGSYSTSGDVTIPYESENLYPPQPPRREEVSAKKEEDVKIYSVKSKEPEKPQEYVKLFSPKTKKPAPPAPSVINIASPPPVEIPSPISRPPRERAEIPAAPAISLAVPKPKEAKVYASQKFEETQEIGFEQLLKGLERRDGFDNDNIPTDSDGMPVSHKTKRVMDAIFKQSKPSLFINVNKGEE